MVRVMLTPVPAGVLESNGAYALKVNILVSLKPGDDRPDSQPLQLSEIDYKKFGEWVTGIMKNISLKLNPDAKSVVRMGTQSFTFCTEKDCRKRSQSEINANFIKLFEDTIFKKFQDNLNDNRFEASILQELKDTNGRNLTELKKELKANSDKKKNYEDRYQQYKKRKLRLDDLAAGLESDIKDNQSELDAFKLTLNEKNHKDEVSNYENRGRNLKSREEKGMADCKKNIDSLTIAIEAIKISISQREDLQKELKRTTASGILTINNDDLKKISTGISNIQTSIINSAIDDPKKKQAINAQPPNLESGYTSNINATRIVYFSDVIGYFFNYPTALYDLGMMHAFQMSVNVADLNQVILEGGILTLEARDDSGSKSFEYLKDEAYTKGVSYQLFPYLSKGKPAVHFMPRPKSFNTDQKKSMFWNGFLHLKSVDDNNERRFILNQNNPQQMNFRQSDIEKGLFSDHTKGFYLVKREAVDPSENSVKDKLLYLEDLLIGYRIDVKRIVTEAPDLKTNWKSLHQRSGNIILDNKNIIINDEGWLSKDSLVQVKKKVFVSLKDAAEINKQPLSLNHLELGVYNVLNESAIPTGLVVSLADSDHENTKKNETASYFINVKNFNGQPPGIIAGNLTKLNDDLMSWKIGMKRMACNDQGEFFYDVYVDEGKHVSAASFLPTIVICYINGLSLNAPVVMSSELKKEYSKTQPQSKSDASVLDGLIGYLGQCGIRIDQMKPFPGSLVALRINDIYQVRCRLVCLDGTSLPMTANTDNLDYTLQKQFLRQDSLPSPLIIDYLNKDYKYAGESTYRVIVCSDEGKMSSYRVILPPPTTWQLAEWSKMMDGNNYKPDAFKLNKYAKRYMPNYEKSKLPTEKNTYVLTGDNGKVPNIFNPVPGFEINYIPDPMAKFFRIVATYKNRNNILTNLGGYSTNILSFFTNPNDPSPENVIAYKLTIRAIGPDEIPGFGKIVTVINKIGEIILSVPITEDIELLVRSLPFGDFEQAHNLKHYYADSEVLKTVAFRGNKPYPVLFGDQKIVATHANTNAVHWPWFISSADQDESKTILQSRKELKPDQLRITGRLFFPGNTCDQLELYGEWVNTIDDPVHGDPLRFETITKKLYDFFESDRLFILSKMSVSNGYIDTTGDLPNNRIVHDDLEEYQFNVVHDTQDSKHKIIRYWLVAKNRFLNLLEPQKKDHHVLNNDDLSLRSKWFPLRVLSSLAPETPKIAYVLPVFRWQRKKGEDHNRAGDTIRVYFERPWFSSGIGERVALVLMKPNPSADIIKKITPYCSGWGSDHTTGNPGLAKMTLSDLTNAKRFTLTENSTNIGNELFSNVAARLFDYALFDVSFSAEKKLWYTDITFQLPNNSYCPFVRLSIARFQEYSVEGKHFSDVVFTDFVQLYPERKITVKRDMTGIINIEILPSLSKKQIGQTDTQLPVSVKKPNIIRATFFKNDGRSENEDLFFSDKAAETYELQYEAAENLYSKEIKAYKANDKLMLVIREYENYSDGDLNESKLRLVLADTIHSDNFR